MEILEKIQNLKPKTPNCFAFLIIFLIAIIYMFPMFLGKIDLPIDMRDIRMYPWRYHAMDKKIVKKILWKGQFQKKDLTYDSEIGADVFVLQTQPQSSSQITFDFNLKENQLLTKREFSDHNFFISFEFKNPANQNDNYTFGLNIIGSDGRVYAPGHALAPLSAKDWYKATFHINNFLSQLNSLNDLKNYKLQIVGENKDLETPAFLRIANIEFTDEDFSNVIKVHNHYNNDLIQIFAPAREYFSKSLKHFRVPFWNNYILTGTEFLAEPQIGFFQPFYFLIYFLFDHFTAHLIVTFLCFVLCGVGAYVLARFWGLSIGGSLLSAVVYMFQPVNVTWFSYEHTLMNTCLIPFLILFYEKYLTQNRFVNKYLLLTTGVTGLILVSGHLQRVYYSLIFFVLFAAFRFITTSITSKKLQINQLLAVLFIFSISFMIGAIVILPFMPLYLDSHRGAIPSALVSKTALPLKAFWGLFYPFYQGVPEWPLSGVINNDPGYATYKLGFMRNYLYFGLLPFILFLISLKTIQKNKITLFFVLVMVLSLLVCTGSPVYYFLREILPGFKTMQHHKFLMLYSLSVPYLTGIGFNEILKFKSRASNNLIVILFLVIVSFDLMYYSSYFVTWSNRSDYKPVHQGGVIEFLKNKQKESKEPFRVLPFISHKVKGTILKSDIAEPNTLMPYGIEDVSGYSSFIPKDLYYIFYYIQLQDKEKLYKGEIFNLFSNFNTPYPISNYHSKILDLLNVKYFIVPNFLTIESNRVKRVFTGDSTVYENKTYLPRAFLVPDYEIIEDPKDIIVRLDSEEFDPRKTVILDNRQQTIDNRQQTIDNRQQARDNRQQSVVRGLMSVVSFSNYEPENIKLKVQTNAPAFLVLGHNLNDNWKVKINGKEGKHFQANLVQRAVYLPKAGNYEVEFYYYPKLLLIGLIISLIGVSLLICFALVIARERRRPK